LSFGSSLDFNIFHFGNTFLNNETGDLYITNSADDKDILFRCDNGAGGVATYFSIDSSAQLNRFAKNVMWNDNVVAYFGGGFDLKIIHNGTFSSIQNNTGDFKIINYADDTDIIFENDNGSGGTTEYFKLNGFAVRTDVLQNFRTQDNIKFQAGSSGDFSIFHNGTDSYLENDTGDLYIRNNVNDKDIIFQSDDGSGGIATYFFLDGSLADGTNVFTKFVDNSWITMGDGGDLLIGHQATSSKIENYTGPLYIVNKADNQDIIFQSDDGSGGITEYFRLDGNLGYSVASKDIRLQDNVNIGMGSSGDYAQFHDGTNTYLSNGTGDFYIRNQADDKDIIFQADNGSGGNATYLFLDGQNTRTEFLKDVKFPDNVKANFGTSVDLQIYHDGSNSYIEDTGSGNLFIRAAANAQIEDANGENMAIFKQDDAVELYYDGNKKLETTSTGIKILGISEYADNTAAIAGGLTTGDVYRTGDLLKIVH